MALAAVCWAEEAASLALCLAFASPEAGAFGGLCGSVGAGHHPGDELLVDRGGQLFARALGGEDAVDVVLAGRV